MQIPFELGHRARMKETWALKCEEGEKIQLDGVSVKSNLKIAKTPHRSNEILLKLLRKIQIDFTGK